MIKSRVQKLAVVAVLAIGSIVLTPIAAQAVFVPHESDQASCDSTIGSFAWSNMGLSHATLTSLTVQTTFGTETVSSPYVAAGDHKLAVSICATEEQGNKTDLDVYQQISAGNDSYDLTGATTPAGHPIDANSIFTVAMSDLGTRASAYTFSLIHGVVTNWVPTNLGTSSAALTLSFKPTRTPTIDTSLHPEWADCTQTPPHCTATNSALDALQASLDMDFGAGDFTEFTGVYFGLTGSVAGFVAREGGGLSVTLGGPHLRDDGTTPNTGSMQAFLPTSVMHDALGLTPAEAAAGGLSVDRTDGGSPTDAPFTVTPVAGGAIITVTSITFSSPVYDIHGPSGYTDGHGVPHKPVVGLAESGSGYWLATTDGGVYSFGRQNFYGSMAGKRLASPIVGIAATRSGEGYWLVAADGGVFAFGDAKFYGSMGAKHLNKPVVGISGTSTDGGYALVASDGGVFAFGDQPFKGSMGGRPLNKPIVSIATGGSGYFLAASDGGVFTFGTASFAGSAANIKLNKPIVSIVPIGGDGYLLVAADGGLFSYGGPVITSSLPSKKLNAPVVGAVLDEGDGGLYLAASDGGVFGIGAEGDIPFLGSLV